MKNNNQLVLANLSCCKAIKQKISNQRKTCYFLRITALIEVVLILRYFFKVYFVISTKENYSKSSKGHSYF